MFFLRRESRLNAGLARVRSWASSVNKATGGLFGGLVGVATVAGVTRAFGAMLDKLGGIYDESKKLRVTTDDYQAMAYAADQTGTFQAISTMDTAIRAARPRNSGRHPNCGTNHCTGRVEATMPMEPDMSIQELARSCMGGDIQRR